MTLLVFRSSNVFAGAVCHTHRTCGCCSGEPIHCSLLTSNSVLPPPFESILSGRSSAMFGLVMPIAVPFFGAALDR